MTDATQINVRLLFFGAAREAAGCSEEELTVRAPATAASVFAEVVARHPTLRRFGRALLVAVNEEYAGMDAPVSAHDEIAIFPPVSGGAADEAHEQSAQDFFELTTEPIDVGAVARRLVPTRAGATVTLDGYVREWTKGRRTLHLVYEAYDPMALAEMRRLCEEARRRFRIAHIGIVHRTGRTDIG